MIEAHIFIFYIFSKGALVDFECHYRRLLPAVYRIAPFLMRNPYCSAQSIRPKP